MSDLRLYNFHDNLDFFRSLLHFLNYGYSQHEFEILISGGQFCTPRCLIIFVYFSSHNLDILKLNTYKTNRNLIRAYSTTSNLNSYEKELDSNGIYASILKTHLKKELPILRILDMTISGFSHNNTLITTNRNVSEIFLECSQQVPCISYVTVQDFCLSINSSG